MGYGKPDGGCSISRDRARRVLCLPICVALSSGVQDKIISILASFQDRRVEKPSEF